MPSPLLPHLPERPAKPRAKGVTMVMDKGLSLTEARNLVESAAEYTDYVKLGFGTSLFTPNVKEKVKLYQDAGIQCFLGGTLFEAFYVRGILDDYLKLVSDLGLEVIEVSDGSMVIAHDVKCEIITRLAKDFRIFSEVGSKEAGILIAPGRWISMMTNELEAGAWKVIAESRESGTVGIYRPSGHAHTALVNRIMNKVSSEDILWEAPKKSQQAWFIKTVGANVNLGNIAPNDVIPLETLRTGLRGDTFFTFLPDEIQSSFK